MKKRLIGMAMAAILAMTALTGCGTAEDTSSLDSLTFTYVTSPLNLPSIVEKEKGIFTKAFADDGIEVKYAEITSGADTGTGSRRCAGAVCRWRNLCHSFCRK